MMLPSFLRSSSMAARSCVPRSHPNAPRSSWVSSSPRRNWAAARDGKCRSSRSVSVGKLWLLLPLGLLCRCANRLPQDHRPRAAPGDEFRRGQPLLGLLNRLPQRFLVGGVDRDLFSRPRRADVKLFLRRGGERLAGLADKPHIDRAALATPARHHVAMRQMPEVFI